MKLSERRGTLRNNERTGAMTDSQCATPATQIDLGLRYIKDRYGLVAGHD